MIRGQTRRLAPTEIKATLNTSIHNRFDIEVVDSKTGEIKQRAQAENLILNQLWTRMFTPATWNNYIHYGSGTGTPAATDTSLFTFNGYGIPSDAIYDFDSTNGVFSARRKIILSETTAVGATLTEVGIAYSTSPTSLCTHAMLKDMNGNQITITKTDTDILNIYATVFAHINTDGYQGGVYGGFNTWVMGISKTLPSTGYATQAGDFGGFSANVNYSYDLANKTITGTFSRFLSNENFNTGQKFIGVPELIVCRVEDIAESWYIPSRIIGESIGTGDGIETDFSTGSFSVKNAQIYVDGVEIISGISVENDYFPDNGYSANILGCAAYEIALNGKPFNLTSPNNACPRQGESRYFYNPYYNYGVKSIYLTSGIVETSDDLINWIKIFERTSTSYTKYTIPEGHKNKKYWKLTGTNNDHTKNCFSGGDADIIPQTTNIKFDVPPAVGAIITADYDPVTIYKDNNHVFDFSFSIQLGEYTT